MKRSILVLMLCGCGLSEPTLYDFKADNQTAWRVAVQPIDTPKAVAEDGEYPIVIEDIEKKIIGILKQSDVLKSVDSINYANLARLKYDLELKIKINDIKARYVGGNRYRIPWFLVWFTLSSIPACFMADEEYEAEIDAWVCLTEKGVEIWDDHINVKFTGALDHFQRGISIWDLFLPGPFLAEASPECLSKVLGPHLLKEFEIELVKKLSKIPPKPVDLLVSVGTRYGYCLSDAKKFAGLFAGQESYTEIIEADSFEAINSLIDRKDIQIQNFVVYFAGCGTLIESGDKFKPALVLDKTIDVESLVQLVKSVPAKSRLIILDAGFNGYFGRVSGTPPNIPITIVPVSDDVPILSACEFNETTTELQAAKSGLFSCYLMSKMNEQSDDDGNGLVTVGEVVEKLKNEPGVIIKLYSTSPDGVIFRCNPKKEDK